uniref:Uncharacterized protein n=1 Tax=Romanomermis culicivorax TaxID=13658 RepID=A0A915KZX8_ROMCU
MDRQEAGPANPNSDADGPPPPNMKMSPPRVELAGPKRDSSDARGANICSLSMLGEQLAQSCATRCSASKEQKVRLKGNLSGAGAVPTLANVGVGVTIPTRAKH